MLDDVVDELTSKGRLAKEYIVQEHGEKYEMELRRHPAVVELDVNGEDGFAWNGHDGLVTVYTIWIGGEPHVQTVDEDVARASAGVGCAVTETEAPADDPPSPADLEAPMTA